MLNRCYLMLLIFLIGCGTTCPHSDTNWRYDPDVDPIYPTIYYEYCVTCGQTIGSGNLEYLKTEMNKEGKDWRWIQRPSGPCMKCNLK